MKKLLLPLSMLLLLTACGDATKIIPTRYSKLDGWADDHHAAAYKVFADSCVVNDRRSNAYQSKAEGAVGVRLNWERVCGMAEQTTDINDEMARAFFEANFTPYKVETEAKAKGTITGYYEPILKGSKKRGAPYLTPVYGLPDDLVKPYYTREEIVRGAIKGKAPVLLYVEDPVMLFFLHIQGSGKVRLPDGSLVGLQYAGQNGRQFVPIGRVLKERGELPTPSMQGIRDWLHDHPRERDEVMNMNPSYVFFKLSPGDEMAKGALGLPLTPLRSVAVDDDRAAYGVPTYIDATMTEFNSSRQEPLKRLFVSQDTGGALHGPHRNDVFFGRGEREEWQAGHQNAQGNVYWLLPVAEGVKLKDGQPAAEKSKEELLNEPKNPTVPPLLPVEEVTPADAPQDNPDTPAAPDAAPAPVQ